MNRYNPQKIEPKWQKYWKNHPELSNADDAIESNKAFVLDMFPYPSGEGLHVGHVESYTATDIYSRYLRMKGKNVLHPQGFDAFGLPAENYAVKTGIHPAITTKKAINTFKKQINSMGFSYDWSKEVNSSDPGYYKWTQWFFLLLYKNGLAYKKKAKVNWCPKCQTVLANEQAEKGKCERCETEVVQKDLEQWFLKITNFVEDNGKTSGLLSGLDKVDWPESTKAAQRNWIGRSEGALIKFKIRNSKSETNSKSKIQNLKHFIEVFTTRVDTIFGCTYCVVAPEHEILKQVQDDIENWLEVEKYLERSKKKTDLDRMEAKEKTGVELKGIKAINPFNNVAVPLYVADYVLGHYGTGVVMAVPAHDERDWEFAKKYSLPIKTVIEPCFWQTIEPGKIREDKPFVERDAILAIVKHWKEEKYLGLKWKDVAWKTFITGGPENGQRFEDAARMEVLEETGYKNLKLIKELPMVHAKFYHVPKGENRFAHFHTFYFELENGEQNEISEKEKSIHEIIWLAKDEVEKIITPDSQKHAFRILQNGETAYCEDGILNDSGDYSGMDSQEAREKITEWLEKNNLGRKKINYKLRDWLVSRQRYWGAPIPIIYCENCGEVPVPEKDLPVLLPNDVDFKPTGESPLKYSKKFQKVKCPKCGANAKRESDTMDTFVCSSWYYLRYTDPKNDKEFASKEKMKKWLPVDLYVGGAEHSVLHLLYSRFFTKVLHNLGYIYFDEPFSKLRHQGTILAEDGTKMSKSKGNVINPDDVVKVYGADALRCFEMFMGPFEDMKPWQTKGIIGVYRFLEKVFNRCRIILEGGKLEGANGDDELFRLTNKLIKKITQDIEGLKFNTAISSLMEALNEAFGLGLNYYITLQADRYFKETFLHLLSPFAPHLAEEIWNKLGHKDSIFEEKWPQYDPKLIQDEEVELVVQVNGKLRDRFRVSVDISEEEVKKQVMASGKIKNLIEGKNIKKIIFIKGKLINLVVL